MALQDFTISFTTTSYIEFNEFSTGSIGPATSAPYLPDGLRDSIGLATSVPYLPNYFIDSIGLATTFPAQVAAIDVIGIATSGPYLPGVLTDAISLAVTSSLSGLLGGIDMSDVIYQGDNGQILVNNLIVTDKAGTGEGKITAVPGGSWLAKGFRTEFESVTVSSSFAFKNDSGKTYTNDGAIITTQVVLPAAPGAGISFTFIRVATQAFRVKPSSGAIIYSGGQMTDGEYLELASDGAVLSLVSDANGNWVATNEQGTLTEETP